ncbi:hypothetical protein HPP92_028116 [Vanilla planifolia]|uniref:NAC domain-containing protein n=1 Tax=Vanilla planifolia TaxID=51239 RepID=A0A835PC90_VANPL|nr:hypothetical protein HPP92_028116 [Vanilla planifolia]
MGLRDIESTLPPGFRFFPSDEELVCHYLHHKVTNRLAACSTMVDVDLHISEPWELPEVARLGENEWYFFSFRDRKYATGSRTNRATRSGYWKATGKDRVVCDPWSGSVAGMRKTLVFYRGRAPQGLKTSWVMHEFRLENPLSPLRVFHKRRGEMMREEAENAEGDDNGGSALPHVAQGSTMDESHIEGCNLALLPYNFFDFPQDLMGSKGMVGMESRHGEEDGFGFLLDLGLDDELGVEDRRCQDGQKNLVSLRKQWNKIRIRIKAKRITIRFDKGDGFGAFLVVLSMAV